MASHFNDLLLQTLKQINVRLDRLDGRVDRLMDEKADKADLDLIHEKLDAKADKADLDATNEKLDGLSGKVDDLGRRIERIDAGIGTLKWVIGAEVAVIGVILAFIKAC